MPKFSAISQKRLDECHPLLRELMYDVIYYMDFSVLCGWRGEADQNEAHDKGLSKLRWPDSKHNKQPSLAVDIAPYPLNWRDHERFKELAYFVLGYAAAKGICVRWGGDFNQNYNEDDDGWHDLPHFEVRP